MRQLFRVFFGKCVDVVMTMSAVFSFLKLRMSIFLLGGGEMWVYNIEEYVSKGGGSWLTNVR